MAEVERQFRSIAWWKDRRALQPADMDSSMQSSSSFPHRTSERTHIPQASTPPFNVGVHSHLRFPSHVDHARVHLPNVDQECAHPSNVDLKRAPQPDALQPCVRPSNADLAALPSYLSVTAQRLEPNRHAMRLKCGLFKDFANWTQRLQDPTLRQRWIEGAQPSDHERALIFQDLEHLARKFTGPVAPASVPGAYQADGLIPPDLASELLAFVKEYEEENKPVAHPNAVGDQVHNVFHPSFYPLLYNLSLALPDGMPPLTLENCLSFIGQGQRIPAPPPSPLLISTKTQWLPSPINVQSDGTARFQSYINNVHPRKYRHAYATMEKIFERFLPLFNAVLTDLLVTANPVKDVKKGERELGFRLWRWMSQGDELPKAYVPPPDPNQVVDLRGRKLQVIVKLTNIDLTPEDPRYPGGPWHVEGTQNDSIIASAIYYYSFENVTDSKLSFRSSFTQGDLQRGHGPSLVYLGSVKSLLGRCLVFPNIIQHRVQPFELLDKTRPGHRKILVFWFIDPSRPVKYTTQNVPPQQLEWLEEEVLAGGATWLGDIMQGSEDSVRERLEARFECPFSFEKAVGYQKDAIHERNVLFLERRAKWEKNVGLVRKSLA